MNYSRNARLLLTGAAFLTLAGPAFSLDGQDLLKKINAAYASSGGTIAAKTVDVKGVDVTLRETTFTPMGADAKPFTVGDIMMTGVVAEANGSYTIDKVTLPNVDFTEDKTRITASDIYLSGLYVPADPNGDKLDSVMLYDEAHSGSVSVVVDGKQVVAIKEAVGSLMQYEDASGVEFEGSVTGISADLSLVNDPASKDAIEKLGLQKIEGDFTTKGSWELASGAFDIEEYSLDFANIGRLDLSFGFSGFTMALVKELQSTAKTMQDKPNDEQAQQAAGIAMLGLMQQMSFTGAEISFADAGITQRGLEYAGAQQGQSADQMKQLVKAMVPIGLSQLKLGELQNTVSAAVNAYLDKPENITVSAAPENPVPFPMIMGAAMGAPETLVKMLNVAVTSNE
ncbi:hypothetical protein [Rhizobium sp. RU36D]|uniref:hypothetical protein n=1 Tax=Rhizobium sp. RU36D TaxID=1907415 RepID=UPI0009D8B910|nr:hypothetical protein [Rhizobium sp. RU36D]SMD09126.1 hypothetical protein SAMN05880593_12087 [Rhizobium sp. RU36D]